MDGANLNKSNESLESANKPVITVNQPQKLEGLLETINLLNSVSERIGEDISGDMGSSGSSTGGQQGDGATSKKSKRDQAIASIPDVPVMQRQLKREIEKEVTTLRKEVKQITRVHKPGNAFKLVKLYARIRRLNGLLEELVNASFEVLKRLYIRTFIDKQPIVQG